MNLIKEKKNLPKVIAASVTVIVLGGGVVAWEYFQHSQNTDSDQSASSTAAPTTAGPGVPSGSVGGPGGGGPGMPSGIPGGPGGPPSAFPGQSAKAGSAGGPKSAKMLTAKARAAAMAKAKKAGAAGKQPPGTLMASGPHAPGTPGFPGTATLPGGAPGGVAVGAPGAPGAPNAAGSAGVDPNTGQPIVKQAADVSTGPDPFSLPKQYWINTGRLRPTVKRLHDVSIPTEIIADVPQLMPLNGPLPIPGAAGPAATATVTSGPARRMAGVVFAENGVFAVLDTAGDTEMVQPGDRVDGGKIISIQADGLTIRTDDDRIVKVPLASSAPGSDSNSGGYQGGGNPGYPGGPPFGGGYPGGAAGG